MLKLDETVVPMPTLMYSLLDAKAKMQPIFVVNLKFLVGRKIIYREGSNHFFGIANKITTHGEIDVDANEFHMNSFHDLHIESLANNFNESMPTYIQSTMFEAVASNCFIDQQYARHLFCIDLADMITRHLLKTKGMTTSMDFKMRGVLPIHFAMLAKESTIMTDAVDIDYPGTVSLKEAVQVHIFPWTNGWRQAQFDANLLCFEVIHTYHIHT